MKYETELNFFQKLLSNSQIPCHIIKNPMSKEILPYFDLGLRNMLNPETDYQKYTRQLIEACNDRTIYRICDEFLCHYIAFRISDFSEENPHNTDENAGCIQINAKVSGQKSTEAEEPCYVLIGPYLIADISIQTLLSHASRFSLPPQVFAQLEKYFTGLPLVADENAMLKLVNTLGEQIWGNLNQFTLQDVRNSVFFDLEPVAERPETSEPEDAFLTMQMLEHRYSIENQLMLAVSQGLTHKAEMYLSSLTNFHYEQRTPDVIRNTKNYLIILNTLLRKAAEQGAVHPLHIDSLSSRFARRIELVTSASSAFDLQKEMVHKYCLLVKNHSMKGYSLLVRKVLTRIDSDLKADLSLKTQAKFLNVNPSYLSTLFKKETGMTLTEYVNRKRIEHGVFLLNSTDMQIQVIAQYCGMPDVNYFTKTFKKIVGKTPKEYRDNFTNAALTH